VDEEGDDEEDGEGDEPAEVDARDDDAASEEESGKWDLISRDIFHQDFMP
jgi:hypothetical protein